MEFTFESKKIHYIAKGQGDLLIILPGNSSSSRAYESQIRYFSQFFNTVSIDYLGTGYSDRISLVNENWWRYSAEQVNALINHLGYKKAHVIGSSGGAAVAVFQAADYPEKISSLVLDSFSLKFTLEMFWHNVLTARRNPRDLMQRFWYFCHGNDWQDVIRQDTENIRKIVENGGDWLGDSPSRVCCPSLLIGCRKDSFIPQIENDYIELSGLMKDSRIILAEKGDHPLIWTNPDFFNQEVLKFIPRNR